MDGRSPAEDAQRSFHVSRICSCGVVLTGCLPPNRTLITAAQPVPDLPLHDWLVECTHGGQHFGVDGRRTLRQIVPPFRVPYIDSRNGTVLLLLLFNEFKAKRGAGVPGMDFDCVRAESNMYEVQLLGFAPTRCRGDERYGRSSPASCSPSQRSRFSVNVAIGRYCWQHRCRHGHQLELWAAATGLSMYPAAINLCAAPRRDVPWIQNW